MIINTLLFVVNLVLLALFAKGCYEMGKSEGIRWAGEHYRKCRESWAEENRLLRAALDCYRSEDTLKESDHD